MQWPRPPCSRASSIACARGARAVLPRTSGYTHMPWTAPPITCTRSCRRSRSVASHRFVVASTMAGACLAAFAVGYLLLQSTAFGMAAAVGLIGMTVIFVDPFVGLVTYLLLLYTRPQDYVPAM